MKIAQGKFTIPVLLALLSPLTSTSGWALEPQTFFNFQQGLGTVRGALIEGPDGNFYGTTPNGGPQASGAVFRVTPAGVLTILVSDQSNPAAGVVFGNDGLLYGMSGTGGPFLKGTVFKVTTNGVLANVAVLDGTNGANPQASLVLGKDGNLYGTTSEGGTGSGGSIFRIVLTPQFTSIAKGPGGSVLLTGIGPSGAPFRLLASDDLSTPIASRTLLTTGAFDTNGQFSFTDEGAATVNTRFYRVSTP
jgi:uncharacterized repeat protein (TIGR03803 family)